LCIHEAARRFVHRVHSGAVVPQTQSQVRANEASVYSSRSVGKHGERSDACITHRGSDMHRSQPISYVFILVIGEKRKQGRAA
jgi:hypothetical protein